jgi:hypothetical protein
MNGVALQFSRVVSPVADMKIWNASSDGFSFVISYESRSGPGLHGRTGFLASWRPIHQNRCAVRVAGSPFKTLAQAEEACDAMLGMLTGKPLRSKPCRVIPLSARSSPSMWLPEN